MHEGGVFASSLEATPEHRGLGFTVFGPLGARHGDDELTLGGPKERSVLATLLAADGEAVTVDALVEAVWGDHPPRSAVRTLHAYVARLRKALAGDGSGEEVLVTRGRSYQLVVEGTSVDAARFADEAGLGRSLTERGDPGGAVAAFDRALREWAGPPFEGHEDIERCAVAARSLQEIRRGVVEDRFDALLTLGQTAELVPALEAAVGEEPLRERRWGQLMLALYRCGRQAEALRAFQRARDALVDALGVDPGPELQELESAILAHDDDRLRAVTSADDPIVALPAALDAAGGALVGRDQELASLVEGWEQLRSGRGGFVSLVGPEGIGKTRLIAELAAIAHQQQAVICFARCDADHRSARAVFDQALRSAGSSLMRVQSDARIGEALGATIARRLTAWAASAPVLVVLDDLHEAEADVLEVVAEVANASRAAAALVVAVFRTEPGDTPRRTGGEQQMVLGGLERDAVRDICDLYGDAWSAGEVDTIQTETSGVPLLVHEQAMARARDAAARRVGEAAQQAQLAEVRLVASQQAVADEVVGIQRVIEQRRLQMASRTDPTTASVCPFRGLRSFDTEDATWFFGRERLVAEIVARLVARPAIAVVGASGSGKSSLLRAGVVPALAHGVLPGSESWRVAILTPGADPVRRLRAEIDVLDPDRAQPRPRTVFVIDQLEELFTLCDDPDRRDEFSGLLAEQVAGGAVLLAAVRADHLVDVGEVDSLARILGGNNLLVGPLRGREMFDAIVRPAQRAGLQVEEGLAQEIIADAQGAAGVLPLMQTALLETWVRRRGNLLSLDGYHAAGGVSGAVARQAEALYGGLTEPERAAARRTLLRLADVSRDGQLDLRRRVPIEDLAASGDGVDRRALDALVGQRLVTLGDGTAEVTHEALLREWPRLRQWLEDDVDGRELHHRLEETARSWDADGRDPSALLRGSRLSLTEEWAATHANDLNDRERDFLVASQAAATSELDEARDQAERDRRTNGRLRRLLAVTSVLVVVALLTGALALRQRDRANRATGDARANSLSADASRLSAQALVDDRIDRALLTAVAAVDLDDAPDTRAGLIETIQRAPRAERIVRLPNGARPQALAVSPDGSLLAVADDSGLTHVLDATTLVEKTTLEQASWGLTFLPDGTLAYGLQDLSGGGVRVVDPLHPEVTLVRFNSEWTRGPDAITADGSGRLIAVATLSGEGTRLSVWEPWNPKVPRREVWDCSEGMCGASPTGALLRRDLDGAVVSLDMASDGDTLVVGLVDRAVLLDPRTGRLLRTFPGVAGSERGSPASILETAGLVAVGNAEGANLHDATTGAVVRTISTQNDVTSMAVAPSEDQLVFGTVEGTEVWNVDGTPVGRLVGQANDTRSVALHPDGRHAFSVSLDGTVVRWDVNARDAIFSRVDGNEPLRGAEVSSRVEVAPDGDVFYVLPTEIAVRDGGTGDWVEPIETPSSNPTAPDDAAVSSVDWSADGRLLAVGTGWGHVALYDRGTGESLADWTESRGRSVMHVQFSPDGSTLAVGLANDVLDGAVPESDRGPDVVFLDADALELVDAIEVPEIGFSGVTMVRYEPGGDRLLVAHCCDWSASPSVPLRPEFVALYDLETGRAVWRRETDVIDAGFASDGARIVVGGSAGRIAVLDATDGSEVVDSVAAHDGFTEHVSFSPDGRVVLSAGTDQLVRLWDASDLRAAGTFDAADGISPGGSTARFMDEGRRVRMLDDERVWDAPIDLAELTGRVCGLVGRELTEGEWKLLAPGRPYREICA